MTSPIESYTKDFHAGDELKASELNGLVSAINETRNRLNSVITDLGTLDGKITAQNSKIAAAEEKVVELSGKVTNLTSNVTDLSSRVVNIKSDVSALSAEVTSIKADNTSIHNDISTLRDTLNAVSTEMRDFINSSSENFVRFVINPDTVLSDSIFVTRCVYGSVEHLGLIESELLTISGESICEQKFFSYYDSSVKLKRIYSSGAWSSWEPITA